MVSIIIPAYNVEQYIDQCIQSIIDQDYKDFECIIIDDGSTDNTYAKGISWSIKDNRIIIIHQKNSGVSIARNKGIENSKGEYITFVDSDDFVNKSYLSDMLSHTNIMQDLIISGLILYPIKPTYNPLVPNNNKTFIISPENTEDIVLLNEKSLLHGPVGKLYRSKIIKEHNIRFNPNLSLGEDLNFNYDYLNYVQTITNVPKVNYYYRETGANSLSNKFRENLFDISYQLWHRIKDFYVTHYIWDHISQQSMYKLLWAFIYESIFQYPHLKNKKLQYIKSILGIPEIKELKKYKHTYPCSEWIKNAIINRRAWLFYLYFTLRK